MHFTGNICIIKGYEYLTPQQYIKQVILKNVNPDWIVFQALILFEIH